MAIEHCMEDHAFDGVIRHIKRAALDRVEVLAVAAANTMRRLKLRRDMSVARRDIPAGSDQGDTMSLIVWMDGLERNFRGAVRQVVVIDATCQLRINGG